MLLVPGIGGFACASGIMIPQAIIRFYILFISGFGMSGYRDCGELELPIRSSEKALRSLVLFLGLPFFRSSLINFRTLALRALDRATLARVCRSVM